MVTPPYGLFLQAQWESSGLRYPLQRFCFLGGIFYFFFEEERVGNVCIVTGATCEDVSKVHYK